MNLRLIKTIINKPNPTCYTEIQIYPGSTIQDAAIKAIEQQAQHPNEIEFEFNSIMIRTFKNNTAKDLINQYYYEIEDRR